VPLAAVLPQRAASWRWHQHRLQEAAAQQHAEQQPVAMQLLKAYPGSQFHNNGTRLVIPVNASARLLLR
jgi:hypothetical protein